MAVYKRLSIDKTHVKPLLTNGCKPGPARKVYLECLANGTLVCIVLFESNFVVRPNAHKLFYTRIVRQHHLCLGLR